MSGLSFAVKKAKNKATAVLTDVKRTSGTAIDVKRLAKRHGIEVRHASFKDAGISGFLFRAEDGNVIIAVNENNSEMRQRFTIAHELGHYFLHVNETMHVDEHETVSAIYFRDSESSNATKLNEIQANQFAAELLMPSKEVFALAKQELSKRRSMEEVSEDLAKKYEVSITAMSVKLGHSIL
jgi:Zn-dependent peptidase ImmA (M78 family)